MAIAPIIPAALPSLDSILSLPSTSPATTAPVDGAAQSFGGSFTDALQSLSEAHNEVDDLAVKAATGDLTAIHDFTIATSEVQLMTELTVEIRNKAIESFNDIMRMQV